MTPPGNSYSNISEPKVAAPLRDLPRDARGYHVPAEATWTDDGPLLSKIEPLMNMVCAAYRVCAVCGLPLRRDELVWRIHDEMSRRETLRELAGGENLVGENDAPGHLVCMLYSALVCPYWRTAGGRLGQDSIYEPGAKRGEHASVMGFTDFAVLLDPSQPIGGQEGQRFPFLYQGFGEEIVFRDPLVELADRYDRERVAVGGRYKSTRRRHYAPAFGGAKRLEREAKAATHRRSLIGPDEVVVYEGADVWLCPSGWM